MKEQTRKWLEYADDNLSSARLLLENKLFNPCLQNIQQSVEKMLKVALIECGIKIKKTHSINELVMILAEKGHKVDIGEDDRDLLDSIYIYHRSILLVVFCLTLNRMCKPVEGAW